MKRKWKAALLKLSHFRLLIDRTLCYLTKITCNCRKIGEARQISPSHTFTRIINILVSYFSHRLTDLKFPQ